MMFACLFLSIGGLIAYVQLSGRLDDSVGELEASLTAVDDPNSQAGFETTFIYDRNNNQLWEIFGQGRRQRISLDQIPDYVIQATISVEDDNFYDNPGFDVSSNARAVYQMARYRQVVSGASTITQQLVRNVVFDPEYRQERSVERKVEEIALAFVMTQRLSKDEILELYLNTIYYGNLSYGIEAAAQSYFGKSASELELHEAALLAGLPQLPAVIDPLNPDPDIQAAVIDRQYLILDLMVEEGYITQAEADTAKTRPLNYVSPEVPLEAPHFTLYAVEELEALLADLGIPAETVADGGLQVYTSIDLEFQAIAQRAAENTVNQLRDAHNLTNASVVVIHPPSGEIMAMVGSVDYNNEVIDGQVNVATAMRQPGSTMKPFTYAANFELGYGAQTIFWDVETRFGVAGQADYIPLNYDRRFHGPVRMREALANSYNVPAVLALENVGVEYLVSFLQRMGTQSLSSESGRYGLSLTLGGGEITLLEMTSNYATLARGGAYVEPRAILCVLDKNERVIYQYENRCPKGTITERSVLEYANRVQVMDPRVAFIISDILADNPARTPAMGANSPLNTGSLVSSVKTGTTDNFRDNWTVGYTSDVTVGVWSGNSDNSQMVNISGLAGAAPIWNAVITEIYRRRQMPPSVLNPPPGLNAIPICNLRTLSDPANSCSTRYEWFLDSPPLVPDGAGNLVPAALTPPQALPLSEFGPQLYEREEGIIEVAVRPLDPNQQAILQSQNPGAAVAPRYCMVPVEVLAQVPDAQSLLFIRPPTNPNRHTNAYRYAANAGIPILPQFPCTGDTLVGFGPVDPGAQAIIVSPTNGQTVSGVIPIYGVVNYPDGLQFDYYKLEVRGGPFTDWTTMGNVHSNEVLQAEVLEVFYAEALPPGPYELRLWLQGALEPITYTVAINLVSP
jgi:penicillin-binding protein 1C